MEEADTRAHRLDARLLEIDKQIKAAKTSVRRGKYLSTYQWKIAQVLLVLARGEPTAAMTFVRSKSSDKHDVDSFLAQIQIRLTAWWEATEEHVRNRLIESNDENPPSQALSAARKFLVDYKLEAWVEEQNLTRGLSPLSSLVANQARILARENGATLPTKKCSWKKWMQRFRLKHGLRLKVQPTKEPLTEHEMHAKVQNIERWAYYNQAWGFPQIGKIN